MGCLLLALALLGAVDARAQSDAQKEAARERFGRGIERLRAEDYAGAVAEFDKAYQLAPYPVILFNLGVAQARLGRAVEAEAAFERVIAEPGTLSAERLAQAQRELGAQKARIGELSVEVSEKGASVRVDGVDVGRSPLASRLRLTGGTHYVEAVKQGYAPSRKEVRLAAESQREVRLELEPTDHAMAQLWIRSPLTDAEIWLDGARVGSTPLSQSLAVLPGKHQIELRRSGYLSARETVELGPGSTAELSLALRVDQQALEASSGMLVLDAEAAEQLVVTVDGKRLGRYDQPLVLPPGLHDLRIERGGFYPGTLRVRVASGESVTRQVILDPTAETIAEHDRQVALFRGLALGGLIGGLAIAGGGVGYTLWNEGRVDDLDSELTTRTGPGGDCASGGLDKPECVALATDLDGARGDRPIGYALIGVGGALVVTGVVLFLVAPDADEYQPDVEASFEEALLPRLELGREGALLGVGGRF
jgi:hypothetical protein